MNIYIISCRKIRGVYPYNFREYRFLVNISGTLFSEILMVEYQFMYLHNI